MVMHRYGGCDGVRDGYEYRNRFEQVLAEIKAAKPSWATPVMLFGLTVGFSSMDGLTLYSIFDACFVQSALMGKVMAAGIAVVLNILPLFIARNLHLLSDNLEKNAKMMLAMYITGFFLIYGSTVYLRFAFKDTYGTERQEATLENTAADVDSQESDEDVVNEKKANAAATLLAISPLITSLLGFGIAYVSDNPLEKKIEECKIIKVEKEQEIDETEAAICQAEFVLKNGIATMVNHDEELMYAALDNSNAMAELMKARARNLLAQYLGDAQSISKLSYEMKEPETDKADAFADSLSATGFDIEDMELIDEAA